MAAAGSAARASRALRGGVVLVTLTFVYVLNFLDRQLLGILAKPIQDSLHITDGQLGLIGGLYFALLLLLHRDPGRLVRRPHQSRDRAVARLRDLERRRRSRAGWRPPIRSSSRRA